MEYVLWFIVYFIVIFILYYFLVVRKCEIDKRKKKPSEVILLVNAYKLDINKFSYRKFLIMNGLVTAFVISSVAIFIPIFKGFLFQILFAFIILIPVAILCFSILGKYYKKKQDEDNSLELEKEKKYIEKRNAKRKKKEEKKKNRRSDKHVK